MSKWEPTASQSSDNQVVADLRCSFWGLLDSEKRATLRELMKFDVSEFEDLSKEDLLILLAPALLVA